MKWFAGVLLLVMNVSVGTALAHGERERFVEVAVTLFGHPVHPIFVVFPLALFPVALLFDAIYLWRRQAFWWRASLWMISLGLVGAIVAAVLGSVDYVVALPGSGEVHETAETHWHWIVAGVGVFLVNMVIRLMRGREGPPRGIARLGLALSLLGVGLIWTGGFYGGHLVFDHGVGVVRPQADLDPAGGRGPGAEEKATHNHAL